MTDVPRLRHKSAGLYACLLENEAPRLRLVIRSWRACAHYQKWNTSSCSSLESLPASTLLSQPYILPVSLRIALFFVSILVCIIVPALFRLPVRFAWLPLSSFSPRLSWSIYPSPSVTAPCRLSPPCISAWTCACRRKCCSASALPCPQGKELCPQGKQMGPNALLIPVTSQNIPADAHTGPIASPHKHPGPRLKLLRGSLWIANLMAKSAEVWDTDQVYTSPVLTGIFCCGPLKMENFSCCFFAWIG